MENSRVQNNKENVGLVDLGSRRLDRQELLGDLSSIPNELIVHILSFLPNIEDVHAFGLVSYTCLNLSRSDGLWRTLMPRVIPRIWGSLNPEQKNQVLLDHSRQCRLRDPLEYSGPISYHNKEMKQLRVCGDHLVYLYKTEKKSGLRIWNHQTGELSRFCLASEARLLAMNEDAVVTASFREIKVFDLKTGECLFTTPYSNFSTSLVISGDKFVIWSGDIGFLWNWKESQLIKEIRVNFFDDFFFSFDDFFIFKSEDSTYQVASLDTGENLFQFRAGLNPVFSSLGNTLLISDRGVIRRLDAKTGQEKEGLRVAQDTENCCMSAEGALIFSGNKEGTLRLWNAETGRLLRSSETGQGALAACVLSEGLAYTYGKEGTVLKVWNVAKGSLFQEINVDSQIQRCDIVGTNVIVQTVKNRCFRGTNENVFVFSRRFSNHPKLVEQPTKLQKEQKVQGNRMKSLLTSLSHVS